MWNFTLSGSFGLSDGWGKRMMFLYRPVPYRKKSRGMFRYSSGKSACSLMYAGETHHVSRVLSQVSCSCISFFIFLLLFLLFFFFFSSTFLGLVFDIPVPGTGPSVLVSRIPKAIVMACARLTVAPTGSLLKRRDLDSDEPAGLTSKSWLISMQSHRFGSTRLFV